MSRRAKDWMFLLDRDLWQFYKLQDLQDDVQQSRLRAISASRRSTQAEEAQAEAVARTALLVHSVVEVLVRKGIITREEIAAVAEEFDRLDGQADGKLAQSTAAEERPAERTLSPEEFLKDLERS